MEKMQAQSTPQTQRRPALPKPKKGRKWIKRIIAIVVIAAVAVLVLRGCFGGGGISAVGAYLSDTALYQDMTVYVSGTGTIEPIQSYKVTTLIQGEILEAPFEEGQTVHNGDLLFRIDSSDVENAISQAQLTLQQAEQNYEQAQQSLQQAELGLLQSQQSLEQSQQQVQQAQQAKQQAEQQVRQAEQAKQQAEQAEQQAGYAKQQAEQAQQQAEYAKQQAQLSYDQLLKTQSDSREDLSIQASESGVITKLYVDQGDKVMAGTLIADILDRDHMKLTVPFHSADASQFQAGQAAAVTVDGSLEALSGTIDSIAATDSVGAGGALVRNVTILVDNPGALSTSSTGTASINGAVCAASAAFAYAASEQVYAKASGELESLTVKEGDRVVKDQVIGMVEEPDMESQIESARLNVENAALSADSAALNVDSTTLNMENAALSVDSAALGVDNASLGVDNAALGVDSAVLNVNTVALNVENARLNVESVRLSVENARLNVESARLSLERVQDQLEDYSITSTIDGTVIEKNYEVGDNIDATTASAAGVSYPAVIYDLSALTFDMTIDERDISSIQVGQTVEITADALDGRSFTGKVDKVNINGTTVNGKTTYPVTVLVDGAPSELYPGMNVSAKIIVEEAGRVLCIPVDYVSRGNVVLVALPGAMDENGNVVDRGKIEEREITLGRSNEEYIEVLDGLEEGDIVLLENNASSAMMAFMGV